MNITLIIVLYFPDLKVISRNLLILEKYCSRIIFVDNSTAPSLSKEYLSDFNCEYFSLGSNKGIAYAQNFGLSMINSSTNTYILLLDQDSIVTSSLFTAYQDISKRMLTQNITEYAIGPSSFDLLTAQSHKRKISIPFFCDSYSLIKVSQLQSSGTFFPSTLLEYSPLLDSNLFIDYVDWSFCYKLLRYNVPIFQILDVSIGHQLGSGPFLIPVLNIPIFNISSPFRYFYQVRNIFYLFARKHISYRMFVKLVFSQLFRIILTFVFCKYKLSVLSYSSKGLVHGLKYFLPGDAHVSEY